MKIKAETLEFLLEACRRTFPNEFLGMLRAEKGVITEVLIIPGTGFERHSSFLNEWFLPIDPSIVGSAHSHPGPPLPSRADKNFFSKGRFHLIVGYPYEVSTVAPYDSKGNPAKLEIVK
jgi:proteasome lid subunit RPN8/RPN11